VKNLTGKLLAALFGLCLLTICATTQCGCRSLAPDGVYHGDTLRASAEATIVTSYDLVNTFLTWEFENRALLAGTPGVSAAANRMRVDFPKWYRSANALLDVYALAPSSDTQAQLTKALALLRTALVEAAGYMTAATLPPKT